ncbi:MULTISPECIES: hypothetical protein [Metabacillus]|jgi:hypothetical protein|uniref:Uncharacterized protein n=1 Tax=Metabacillus hrfriensis TaxID=3048891 RepID=A0ACD4RG01_9BACI|nr:MULTISPECIES: hypothetical protein [Metabacillus]UAL53850.1 hypothetical protein K8L98_08795 [Metabacillus dongyingensis]UOK59260.1 hypothetical protein MGI18_10310 [Bacillus sp. OVS6]USK30161.1 hypothetical protein LIT32_08690 [Bacillus sp. CMF21]WHZ59407.1 hypothetical protein QLQ22_08815 [Metabacillus sp. CT-WN-B3]
MDMKKAAEIAKKIVELDVRRDEMLEDLQTVIGKDAQEFLRFVQNGFLKKSS